MAQQGSHVVVQTPSDELCATCLLSTPDSWSEGNSPEACSLSAEGVMEIFSLPSSHIHTLPALDTVLEKGS